MRFIVTFFIFIFFSITVAFADEVKTLRFGVLSFRPKEITATQWQPLANFLEQTLAPNYKVELLPMNYEDLDTAAKNQQIDFILTNPEHYIILKNVLAMNAIATLITLDQGHPVSHFAGVIFTRADRTDIQTIEDLDNKVIASPAEHSLGGYLMQRWELEKHGVHAKRYEFTKMPHDKVVDAVLTGKVDAGFIRSGVLESLTKAGKFTLDENSPLRVIAPHNPSAFDEKIYSLHSTEHYPEWAFAIAKNVDAKVIRTVTLKLLEIPADSAIAKAANIAGFNPAADYTSVETLMLRLRSHPNELKYFSFEDVLWRYRESLIAASIIGFIFLMMLIFLIYTNRRLKKLQHENQKLLLAVEQSPVSIVITDLKGSIEYVNHEFLKVTGYELSDVIGKNPRILKSNNNNQELYPQMWAALSSGKDWHGELINCRKDGSEYIESTLITPVRDIDGKVRHFLAIKRDITEYKKAEEQIKQLAFFDALTNLPNRRKLLDHLQYMIALHHREGNSFAVLMMDLDKFKPVNDSFGHAAGDELLKQVAERIKHCLRECDFVARLGGDEFVVVVHDNQDTVANVANKIITNLTMPFQLCYLNQCNQVQIGTSIGISFYPSHGITAEKLIDCADTALYLAKDKGRGCFAYYEN